MSEIAEWNYDGNTFSLVQREAHFPYKETILREQYNEGLTGLERRGKMHRELS